MCSTSTQPGQGKPPRVSNRNSPATPSALSNLAFHACTTSEPQGALWCTPSCPTQKHRLQEPCTALPAPTIATPHPHPPPPSTLLTSHTVLHRHHLPNHPSCPYCSTECMHHPPSPPLASPRPTPTAPPKNNQQYTQCCTDTRAKLCTSLLPLLQQGVMNTAQSTLAGSYPPPFSRTPPRHNMQCGLCIRICTGP